ncbi:hypothetical protein SDC9_52380 [bioreactor metagenome]|uniref:Uncharacterized protein n=1 Tax=bioreactor metagenome TaxID=1076179 RepID=A0A644WQC7_9ZZZZ
MYSNSAATVGTSPPMLFLLKKILKTLFFYPVQIVNHAHVIFCPVSFIKAFHTGTWESVTIHAIAGIGFCTIADNAVLY